MSVIIPVLDEAGEIGLLLPHWRALREAGAELVVVDGGSADATVSLIERGGFAVLTAPRGRARQMNAGAASARGGLLIFLHADTRLPAAGLDLVRQALRGCHGWGRFDLELDGGGWRLRLVAALINVRSRLSGIATGDQAIFISRQCFEAIGGFPDQPLMEDIELSARLRRRSSPVCLRAKVVTSSRRWRRHGITRTIVTMWWLRLAYACGVPSSMLARFYR
ncbi:TIGR04283 family arsenosugar biosynthesis glycosyltransferase [Synechococcus sp. CS-1325]|nr:TIGR04283 family arsenosugar biosynthesis glycosyltransferase [Synechococcus sp. CS-1325]MCT0230027.1 TIGR04283 family arsenosugar biosynthesis glycosyltransferase [Synechococcus sp. CS-1324]PZV02106.1 MAG: glycosyl transferase [Cyanobium sp.]PZV05545.1 MAG: glycosyl transferase [Cyanobium sp.]